MDYISREAAYETLTEYYHHSTGIQHDALKEALHRVPHADVAPVVRCMDCREYANDDGYCCLFNDLMNANDFCSRGTKRE